MKSKFVFIAAIILAVTTSSWAQVYNFDGIANYSGCQPFLVSSNVGNNNDWLPSHGSASLTGPSNTRRALLRSGLNGNIATSDGIFINYNFESGKKYMIETDASIYSTITPRFKIANNLVPTSNPNCDQEELPINIPTEHVSMNYTASPVGGVHTYSSSVIIPNNNYSQLWVYLPPGHPNENAELESVTIIPMEPEASLKINGSSAFQLDVCYGEPLSLDASGSEYASQYLIDVEDVTGGVSNGNIAQKVYPGGSYPSNLDLYDFVQNNAGWWHFMGGRTYKVRIRLLNDYTNPITWDEKIIYLNFTPSTAQCEFVNADEVVPTTGYNGWAIDVAQFCSNADVYLDCSASSCFDAYSISIQEFDLQNWQGIGQNASTGMVFSNTAPANFNLSNLYGSPLNDGAIYKVSVETRFPWHSKTLFFKKLPASAPTVDGFFPRLKSQELLYSPGGGFGFTMHEICRTGSDYLLDLTDTKCESQYSVSIAKFDWQTWTDNDPNPSNSGWIMTSAPNQIALNDFYPQGFQQGATYRVSIATAQPYTSKSWIFKAIPVCRVRGTQTTRRATSLKQIMNIQLAPNPANNGITTLFVDGLDKEEFTVIVTSINGSEVLKQVVKKRNQFDIDLSSSPKGVYFVTTITNAETITQKLIVN